MNSTLASPQALPANLKSLFNPVEMMVPDKSLIYEIIFWSLGFADSMNLAVKMMGTF